MYLFAIVLFAVLVWLFPKYQPPGDYGVLALMAAICAVIAVLVIRARAE